MVKIASVNVFVSESAAVVELSTGKKYRILLNDYDNLPFACITGAPLENIIIDEEKAGSTETNRFFNGDCVAFLRFLSRKYNIYSSAMSKVAFTDMSKKGLYQKLYSAVLQNQKKPNKLSNTNNTNKIVIEPQELKDLCTLVCNEFEQAGYINDWRYALDKAKYLKEYKKYGVNKIKEYLYQKGVMKDAIDDALEDEFFVDEDGDFENMMNLLSRKFRAGIDKTDRNAVAKAINLLSRNGYSYAQAKKAVTEFIENMEMEDEEEEQEEE
jgi:SOS response regulatory protein OraA/RecX